MDYYKIVWKSTAEKDIRRIDRQFIPIILKKIEELSEHPLPLNYRKLSGVSASYRIRIGDYRVIYQVDEIMKAIIVIYVRHRKDAYRKLDL